MSRSALDVDATTSERMGRVRQKGTAAELAVRAAARRLNLHYRIENRDLPGRPDLANRKRKWAIFVHGCFWHRHQGCVRTTTPKRNRDFWQAKFEANITRDARVIAALQKLGYLVIVIWECEAELLEVANARIQPLLKRGCD